MLPLLLCGGCVSPDQDGFVLCTTYVYWNSAWGMCQAWHMNRTQKILGYVSHIISIFAVYTPIFHNRFCNPSTWSDMLDPGIVGRAGASLFITHQVDSSAFCNNICTTPEHISSINQSINFRKRKGPKLQQIVCWRYRKKGPEFLGDLLQNVLYEQNVVA